MVRIVNGEIVPDEDPRAAGARSGYPALSPRPAPAGGGFSGVYGPATPSSAGQPGGSASGAPGAPGVAQFQPGRVFDWSAPPVELAPEPQGESPLNVPGLRIFGAHARASHLIAIAVAAFMLGWKGLLVGIFIWFMYKSSQAGTTEAGGVPGAPRHAAAGAAAGGGAVGGAAGGASDLMQRFFQGPPPGRAAYTPGSGLQGASPAGRPLGGPPPSAGAGGRSGWEGKGQGHKLGSL